MMSELDEIMKLHQLEKKLVDEVIRNPYRDRVGTLIPLTVNERNKKIENIKKDTRIEIVNKYIEMNKQREKENKPALKVPYLRKDNEQ